MAEMGIIVFVFVFVLASLVRTRLKAGNQTRGVFRRGVVFNELVYRDALTQGPNLYPFTEKANLFYIFHRKWQNGTPLGLTSLKKTSCGYLS